VDFITYSPIFKTPHKGQAKGIEDLKKMVLRYNVKIIALGGIITKRGRSIWGLWLCFYSIFFRGLDG